MSEGFEMNTDELKINIIMKRLTPAVERRTTPDSTGADACRV
jgi:hypothetical protein